MALDGDLQSLLGYLNLQIQVPQSFHHNLIFSLVSP